MMRTPMSLIAFCLLVLACSSESTSSNPSGAAPSSSGSGTSSSATVACRQRRRRHGRRLRGQERYSAEARLLARQRDARGGRCRLRARKGRQLRRLLPEVGGGHARGVGRWMLRARRRADRFGLRGNGGGAKALVRFVDRAEGGHPPRLPRGGSGPSGRLRSLLSHERSKPAMSRRTASALILAAERCQRRGSS